MKLRGDDVPGLEIERDESGVLVVAVLRRDVPSDDAGHRERVVCSALRPRA